MGYLKEECGMQAFNRDGFGRKSDKLLLITLEECEIYVVGKRILLMLSPLILHLYKRHCVRRLLRANLGNINVPFLDHRRLGKLYAPGCQYYKFI